jgi:hypothetical protein
MRSARTRVLLGLVAVSALLVATSLLVRYAGWRYQVAHPGTEPIWLIAMVDVNSEGSVPTWWSSGLLLVGALLAAMLAALPGERALRRGWAVLAGGLGLLSLDEAVALHERLGTVGAALTRGGLHFAWAVPGAALAVGGLAVLALALRQAPRPVCRGLALAAAVHLTGALLLEVVSGVVLQASGDRAGYLLVTAAEEGCEMLGVSLLVWALLGGLELHRTAGGWVLRAAGGTGPERLLDLTAPRQRSGDDALAAADRRR